MREIKGRKRAWSRIIMVRERERLTIGEGRKRE